MTGHRFLKAQIGALPFICPFRFLGMETAHDPIATARPSFSVQNMARTLGRGSAGVHPRERRIITVERPAQLFAWLTEQ
jgi:hypothetical protein